MNIHSKTLRYVWPQLGFKTGGHCLIVGHDSWHLGWYTTDADALNNLTEELCHGEKIHVFHVHLYNQDPDRLILQWIVIPLICEFIEYLRETN